MLWLTGGAMFFALCMIVGLLMLVLSAGGSTFWPVPVERVALLDGSQVAGEVARSESYELTPSLVERLSGPAAERARTLLGDAEKRLIARRLYRVGNFELTQQHYIWVADFDLPADAVVERDPWVIALERVEWGRFFGTLEAYQHDHERTVAAGEDDLRQLVALFDQHGAKLPAEQQTVLTNELTKLRDALAALRRTETQAFVRATCQASADQQWELLLDDQTTVPFDVAKMSDEAIAACERAVGVRQRVVEPEAAWHAFEQEAAEVHTRARRMTRIAKDDIGHLGERIEQARLKVRAAELRTGESFVDRAVELANLREELAAGEAEVARLASLGQRASKVKDASAELRALVEQILVAVRAEFAEQTLATRERESALVEQLKSCPDHLRAAVGRYLELRADVGEQNFTAQRMIADLERLNAQHQLVLRPAGGEPLPLAVASIVRAYPANRLTWSSRLGVYVGRWWEFLSDVPREANSEGGVFPAIFGTVAMTLVMSLAVVPFGVLAALYLREYARGGLIVSILRIAINNLAGVPSIVFGVFGLGFFCYLVGAFLDGGPANAGLTPLAPYSWYLGLAGLAVVAVSAFVVGIASSRAGPNAGGAGRWLGRVALGLWITATLALVYLIFVSPYFGGLFAARLPNPTLGKGGLLWSALTLALMTLPVVIVATEEALSGVPNSMREGSYACGAGKWQTIRRIVLPQALPGIMTGMILAMARGAGEVAPLMLVGAVKVAPELPVDTTFPFVHPERSYLHLGFHIFDLGFQSQNSEAAKPMVFTTTLLLVALIALLNITAVWLRARLRKRFRAVQF